MSDKIFLGVQEMDTFFSVASALTLSTFFPLKSSCKYNLLPVLALKLSVTACKP